MINWLPGILNSFSSAITNGFTEGCNNKIKVLKRNAYGYRNFKRFRNRILHMFSHQMQKQAIAWFTIACSFQFFFFGFTPTIDIEPFFFLWILQMSELLIGPDKHTVTFSMIFSRHWLPQNMDKYSSSSEMKSDYRILIFD